MDEVTVPACKVEGGMQCAPSPVLQALLCLGVWVVSPQQAGSLTNVYQHIFDFHIWSKKHCNARQSRAQQLTAQYDPLKEWTHAKVHLGSARVLRKTVQYWTESFLRSIENWSAPFVWKILLKTNWPVYALGLQSTITVQVSLLSSCWREWEKEGSHLNWSLLFVARKQGHGCQDHTHYLILLVVNLKAIL